jgi:hypothetical protein
MPWPLIFGRQMPDIAHHDFQPIGFVLELRCGLQIVDSTLEGGTHAALLVKNARGILATQVGLMPRCFGYPAAYQCGIGKQTKITGRNDETET